MIVAARQLWERDTQSISVSRSVIETLNYWPTSDWRFYYRPVSAVNSVVYYDSNNDVQTLDPSIYSLDSATNRILLNYGEIWPSIVYRWDAVMIDYQAGETIVPEIVKQALKLKIDGMFELRGLTKDMDAVNKAYEMLVMKYQRGSYP